MSKVILALLTLSGMALAQPAAGWTFGGRQMERRMSCPALDLA